MERKAREGEKSIDKLKVERLPNESFSGGSSIFKKVSSLEKMTEKGLFYVQVSVCMFEISSGCSVHVCVCNS